jgi:hypothetical protein
MGDTKYRSKLIVGEDYWAIWLGGFFLVAGIIIYLFIGRGEMSEQIAEARKALDDHPIKSISWHMAGEQSAKLNGSNTFLGKEIKSIFSKPKTWKGNPIQAFYSPDGKSHPRTTQSNF